MSDCVITQVLGIEIQCIKRDKINLRVVQLVRVGAALPTDRQSGVYIVGNRGKREIAKVIQQSLHKEDPGGKTRAVK